MRPFKEALDQADKNLVDAQRKVSRLEQILADDVEFTKLFLAKVEQAAMLSMIAFERAENPKGSCDKHRFEDLRDEIVKMNKHQIKLARAKQVFILKLDDGSAYEGNALNGQPHGHGTKTYTDGDVYVGQFVEGKRHGQGKLTKEVDDVLE